MVFVPVPDTAEVVMKYNDNTQPAVNVYHVHNSSAWDATSLTALANLFKTWESTHASGQRCVNTYLYDILARDLTTASSANIELAITPVIPGLSNNPQYPNNVTIAVKCQTGLSGRSFRGRTFWIGLDESMGGGSFINGTALANIVGSLESLRTTVNAVAGQSLVVVSKRSGGAPRAVGLSTPITQWIAVDNALDSQRRRLPFHNVHH